MFFEFLSRIGLVILFGTILVSVSNAGTVFACWIMDVRMEKIAVFFGKPVFTIQTRLCPLTIGYIPTGGFVGLDMALFPKKPLSSRCIVTLAGPFAVFVSSLICLGFPHTSASFASAFPQLGESVLSPLSYGKGLIAVFLANAQASPIAGYGILAAKSAALNFLPLPAMPGGRLLIELTEKRDASPLAKLINYLGSLIGIVIVVILVAAVIGYLFHKN
jgi:membrane-associated protease RseP (regulator of RpoE activity)